MKNIQPNYIVEIDKLSVPIYIHVRAKSKSEAGKKALRQAKKSLRVNVLKYKDVVNYAKTVPSTLPRNGRAKREKN